MAKKRMFSQDVISNDNFLEMPDSSQNLYFHLSMQADDDGFISNYKSLMRMLGKKEDDLKVLIAKQFIIPFENGILVIKHWKLNNYIQKDRYTETIYKEEKAQLLLDDNNVYNLYTDCIHSIDKIRLDKNSIDKISIDTKGDNLKDNLSVEEIEWTKNDLFDRFWKAYPKKKNKGKAEAWFKTHKPREELVNEMINKIELLAQTKSWTKEQGQFIPYPTTWLNAKGWEDEISEQDFEPTTNNPFIQALINIKTKEQK